MRAIAIIIVAFGCLATAAGYFPPDGAAPNGVRFIVGLFGIILLVAGIAHGRMRLKRRAAYHDGEQFIGSIIVEGYQGEDDVIARLVFRAAGKAWRMTIDANALGKDRPEAGEALGIGVAYLGEDERIYGLDWEGRSLLLLSPGKRLPENESPKLDR